MELKETREASDSSKIKKSKRMRRNQMRTKDDELRRTQLFPRTDCCSVLESKCGSDNPKNAKQNRKITQMRMTPRHNVF
jgi:hypothetical protein